MAKAKQQSIQHQIDEEGENLLRSKLPRSWKLRNYRPDYGLDFGLELFDEFPDDWDRTSVVETLGEHLFVQLKTVARGNPLPLQIYGRSNVEKGREKLHKDDKIGVLQTYRISLDTATLATVDRMGVAIPVLLVIADLSANRCFYVCINDYIDKILVPKFGSLEGANSRTIHVPVLNEIGVSDGKVGLHWYGKRAKLFAAFQRFMFQNVELQHVYGEDHKALAKYFAERISGYEFWTTTTMWPMVELLGQAVKRFQETGNPGLTRRFEVPAAFDNDEFKTWMDDSEIKELWRQLSLLPQMYEDICREFFLPTSVGMHFSYDAASKALI